MPDQRLREMREQRDAFRSLLKSPGWGLLAEVLEAQIAKHDEDMRTIMTTVDSAVERNGIIGERRGLMFALNIATQQVATIDAYLKTISEKEKERGGTED